MKSMKRLHKGLIALTSTFALTLALTACGGGGDDNNVGGGNVNQPPVDQPPLTGLVEPSDDAQVGGEAVWVIMSDVVSMDPVVSNDSASTDAQSQILEGLLWIRGDGEIHPLLAESFTRLDDLTWEFNLRQGVYFHDGDYLTADAVVASFDRIDATTQVYFIFDVIAETVAIDTYTVHIITHFPFAPLPSHLTHRGGFILSPSSIEEEQNGGRTIAENPVGTGPFRLDYRSHGDYIRFVRNDNYWGEQAFLDSLIFRVIPEPATRIAMVDIGEANGVIALLPDVPQIEATMQHTTLIMSPTASANYIGFNTQGDGPLSNRYVRQALAMATNREDILYGIAEGVGILANSTLAPMVAHSPEGLEALPFDPERAREILVEQGYGDGFTIRYWFNDGNSLRARVGELFQHNMAEIGVTVVIESLEWGAFLESTGEGNHDTFMLAWGVMTGDADYGTRPLFHSSLMGAGGNRFFIDNPELDRLLEAGMSADESERAAIYRQVSELVIQESPMIPLFHPTTPIVLNGIGGFEINFGNTPFFRSVYLTN